MMACSTDGTLNLWNWGGSDEEESTKIAVKVNNITRFQYDEEKLVLGTAEGAVHLFDASTFQEKSSVRFKDPVISLSFVECRLTVITRRAQQEKVWRIDISGSDMRILNQKFDIGYLGFLDQIQGAFMLPDISFAYRYQLIHVWDTKSRRPTMDERKNPYVLVAPHHVTSLNVQDLIWTKRVVVAGCIDGTIAIWNTSQFRCNQRPVKTFQGHTQAVVSLCMLNGQLLSLDKSGKLLMWHGYELENASVTPRVLMENSNLTYLTAHERWFASGSSKDDNINIWTLPDLRLRPE